MLSRGRDVRRIRGMKDKSLSPLARAVLLSISLGCLVIGAKAADEPTAYKLVKEGNRYVGEQAKDRVVQIRSDKSLGSMTPKVWYVVYRDETATMKSVEVKFIAGKMADVKRPTRLLEAIAEKNDELERKKLKVDSDEAIKTALKESILENLKITATAPKLELWNDQPSWKVRIWAAKLKEPTKDADLGEIIISAETGKVMKADVKINKVD
jgi:hypothetical protein